MAAVFRKGVDLNANRAVNAADPSGATDLATKQYVDNVARGLDYKESVRVATVADVALATALVNGTVIDGVTLVTGDRVLVRAQTTGSQNGIYTVPASGAAPRAVDANTTAQVSGGMTTYANEGTANGDKLWVLTTNDPITLATTALSFTTIGGGTSYTAGNGILLTGSAFSVVPDPVAGGGIIVAAAGVRVDTAVVVRKYAADCVATTNPQTFTHGLGTADVDVTIKRASDGAIVYADVTVTSTTLTVDWGAAPSAAEYRVIAHG